MHIGLSRYSAVRVCQFSIFSNSAQDSHNDLLACNTGANLLLSSEEMDRVRYMLVILILSLYCDSQLILIPPVRNQGIENSKLHTDDKITDLSIQCDHLHTGEILQCYQCSETTIEDCHSDKSKLKLDNWALWVAR